MNYNVVVTRNFEKELKRLTKKYVYPENKTVYLLTIYDKSEHANISENRIKELLSEF